MKNILKLLVLILFLLPVSHLAKSNSRNTDHQELIKLVLIAGPNDHCKNKPCHMYIEDLQLLKSALESQKGKVKFDITLYIHERPGIGSLDNVAAVIVHTSADRSKNEWHGIFPQNLDPEGYNSEYMKFLNYFDLQMDRGMGLMVMHYSTWVDHPQARERYMKWLGGYYLEGVSKVDGDNSTEGTTAVETVELATGDHPVLNGVKSWSSEAEYYFNMHLSEEAGFVKPLLQSSLPVDNPQMHTIAWAVERSDGGRGLSFTGGHFHKNLYLDYFRKFVLNAIVWTAGGEVPTKGIRSKVKSDLVE